MPLGEGELPIGKGFAAYVLNLQAEYYRKILASNAYLKAYIDSKRLLLKLNIKDKVIVLNCYIYSTRLKKKLN